MDWFLNNIGEIAAPILAAILGIKQFGPTIKRRLNGPSNPPPPRNRNTDIKDLYGRQEEANERLAICETDIRALNTTCSKIEEEQMRQGEKQEVMHGDIRVLLDRTNR